MFRKFERWRHKNCLDIDIDIVKVSYSGPTYVKLRVLYWNRHYKGYAFPSPETIEIKRGDFSKWSCIEEVCV